MVDSGSSKHFTGPELSRGVEARMHQYSTINPPMEIKGGNIFYGTAQGILPILVRGTENVCWKVKLPIVRVPGLKRKLFSSLPAAQKIVETVITNNGSYLWTVLCRVEWI